MLITRYKDEDLNFHLFDSLSISLVPMPAALLGAALISDGLYWYTAAAFWASASEWLLGAGFGAGAIAAADGLHRYLKVGPVRPPSRYWMHVIGSVLALLLSAANLCYRLVERSTGSVFPAGITLTAVVMCVLTVAAYLGRAFVPRVAVDDDWDVL
jgi:uncharacterized membrane protein